MCKVRNVAADIDYVGSCPLTFWPVPLPMHFEIEYETGFSGFLTV